MVRHPLTPCSSAVRQHGKAHALVLLLFDRRAEHRRVEADGPVEVLHWYVGPDDLIVVAVARFTSRLDDAQRGALETAWIRGAGWFRRRGKWGVRMKRRPRRREGSGPESSRALPSGRDLCVPDWDSLPERISACVLVKIVKGEGGVGAFPGPQVRGTWGTRASRPAAFEDGFELASYAQARIE